MHESENDNSLSNNKITGVIQEKNHLWVSTQNGLNRLNIDTLTFKHYSTKEGLPSNVVYQVRLDEQGFIWGSTSNGIFRLNTLTSKVITYGLHHGLQALDFTSTGGFISNNNELFFGGVAGFNSFIPNDKFLPKQPLAPLVTELRVLNEIITPLDSPILKELIHLTDKLTLDYKQNLFSLAFNSLELTSGSNLQYQYKLLGFNAQWLSPLPGRPQATFTNLNSGQYQFLTRVRKDRAPWGESGRALEIIITPPPWATWWAYSVYLLILFVIFASIYWQYYQRNVQRIAYLANLEKQKKQLDLALWGSGDELWDWNISTEQLKRMNCLDRIDNLTDFSHFNVQSLAAFVHPKDIDRVQSTLVRHLNGELDFYEETYRLKTSTNHWIWVLDRGQVVEKDESNKALRCAGTTKNIDKLKTVEEALIQLTDQLEDRVIIRTPELQKSNESLTKTLKTLKLTQQQLVESEKMAV
jgi:PAS domain-containing protein